MLGLKLEDIKTELGIDYSDESVDARLNRYLLIADAWLKGAIGENYPTSDERAKQLALLIIEDLFDRNSNSVKENATINKLKQDFIMQLQCEGLVFEDGGI